MAKKEIITTCCGEPVMYKRYSTKWWAEKGQANSNYEGNLIMMYCYGCGKLIDGNGFELIPGPNKLIKD